MNRFVLSFFTLLTLTACSTMLDGSTQEFRVETPGVEGAMCYMLRSGYSQRIYPPQTVHITKSNDDITLRCLAMGNREKTIVVEHYESENAVLNIANGFLPGILYDHDTGALFKYPDVVIVDFSDTVVKPMPLPDYQKFLMENPMIADMEEFRPGQPALQRDRYEEVPTLQRRVHGGDADGAVNGETATGDSPAVTEATTSATPKVSPAEALTREMNPSVFGGGTGFTGTTPQGGYPYSSQPAGAPVGGVPIPIYPAQ